jgi:hypothetical protein
MMHGMAPDGRPTEERLAVLLAELPPAPEDWVAAAQELPAARRALAELEERILDGAEDRAQVSADLEAALARAGIESTPPLAAAVRRGLDARPPGG